MEKKKGTLIKTFKGQRITENDVKYDTLLLFYRDENGQKKTIFYDRPEVDYYIIKDKNSPEASHPPLYIGLDQVTHFTTYSDNLYRDIAVNTGALAFYDKVRFNYGVNSYNMKNLFKSPLVYGADVDLEDQYIAKFYREFETDPNYKLHKCYFDIENDIYNFTGFPEPKDAPCPVCLITFIDSKVMTSYTFILRNSKNPGLVEFEKDVEEFKLYMKDKIKECDNLDMEFEFIFFDDEIELIKAFFDKVHEVDPDYLGGWNISFDCPYLQNRLTRLYNKIKNKDMTAAQAAQHAVCDDKYIIQKAANGADMYLTPKAYYIEGQGKTGSRTDSYCILDGVNWIDQMLTYGSVHISEGKPDSFKLDYISYIKLGKEKLPFGPGETIRNQLYKNTKRFIEYNIRDVLLLYEIEEVTQDIDMVQRLSDITVTRKDKCFKKSIALTNFVNKYAYEQGLVMSTNKNTSYGNESDFYKSQYLNDNDLIEIDQRFVDLFNKKDKFGAFVSDPNNNSEVGMEVFKNKESKYLWELVCDFDFSSLYPSIIRAFNLDSRNIVGKFYCVDEEIKERIKEKYHCKDMFALSIKDEDTEDVSEDSDNDNDDVEDLVKSPSGETNDLCSVLTDSLMSQDWNMIGNLFFELPTTSEILEDLKNKRGA